MAEKRREFSRIFKEKAVKLSYQRSNLTKLGKELGVWSSYLHAWRKQYEEFGSGSFCGKGQIRVHPNKEKKIELEKKLKKSELRFEILRKGHKYLFQENLSIYQFIKNNEKIYTISEMCSVFGVVKRNYFTWKKNGIPKKKQYIIALKKEISEIFLSFKKQSGKIKITEELNKRGFKISSVQVGFYMRKLGLRRIAKRKFKTTTYSKHNYYTVPNILNRQFKVNTSSTVWVSDITYIQATQGFLYLTIIMDLYDRKIIGWSLSPRLFTVKTTLVAWEMAISNRKISDGLIFHSDRGVQYANKVFTAKLDSYKCVRSMSRKGDHYDNAVAESFFSILKRELLYPIKLRTPKQLKAEIFDFIENWYNKERIHSTLNYKTIEEFNRI